MNFLGMGPMELVLIVVLALIVFGPAKLPEIMGQVGRAVADFRRATSELSDEFNRTIQAELNETKQTIEETKSALTEVRSAVDSTVNETRAAVSGLPAPKPVAAPPLPAPAPPPSVGTNGAVEQHVAGSTNGSAPPLADTSQWSWESSPGVAPEATAETDAAATSEALAGETSASISSEPGPSAAADGATESEGQDGSAPPSERGERDELLPPY
jgi:sec-independent protein translocase protein TatB